MTTYKVNSIKKTLRAVKFLKIINLSSKLKTTKNHKNQERSKKKSGI